MARWEAKKTTASSINSGNRFINDEGINAEDINKVVEAALYAQEVEAVNDEVINQVGINKEKIATIPLVPNRPIYVNRTYATIRNDIKLGANDDNYWLESSLGDTYYAFLSTDFNRTALVGDKFGCTCSSLDGYVFNISAQVIKGQGSFVYFKILDRNLDEKDDFVVLYKPNPTLYRTMAFNGVTAEEFTETDESGKYTFKGYDGHHSINADLFSDPPSVGNNFFGTVLLKENASDPYPTIATFTAVVTAITNNKVDYSLVDATIFHNGSLDERVDFFDEDISVLKKEVYQNIYPTLARLMSYKHEIINGEFDGKSLHLYVFSSSETPMTTPSDVGLAMQDGAKVIITDGVTIRTVLTITQPSALYYIENGAIANKSLSYSGEFTDNVTEI